MANRQREELRQAEDRSKRAERSERILDAAAELIGRWGYNKTTIEDIARQAGVAKGTIYLHWKTRDDLFWSLLAREDLRLVEKLKENISSDSQGLSMYSLIHHVILATLDSPLAKAMLLMDSNMLGELARKDYSSPSFSERMQGFQIFLEYLRDHGILRADIDIQEHIYRISAITMGFLMVEQWLPDNFKYSNEQIARMTADSIQRTLEQRDLERTDEIIASQQELAEIFVAYTDRLIDILKKTIQGEEELKS